MFESDVSFYFITHRVCLSGYIVCQAISLLARFIMSKMIQVEVVNIQEQSCALHSLLSILIMAHN